jgi:hypothetical protein
LQFGEKEMLPLIRAGVIELGIIPEVVIYKEIHGADDALYHVLQMINGFMADGGSEALINAPKHIGFA